MPGNEFGGQRKLPRSGQVRQQFLYGSQLRRCGTVHLYIIMLTRPGPTLAEETGGPGIVGFYQHFGEYGVVRLLAPASIIERLGTLPIGVGQL